MKRKLFTILAHLFLMSFVVYSQSWNTQVSGTTQNLRSVHFPTFQNGWVVGDGATIRVTSDGGQSWTAQTSPFTNANRDVTFLSATTGFIVGDAGLVIRTTNGGATWAAPAVTYLNSPNIYGISFGSSTTGYAVGTSGSWFKTTNGGANWAQQSNLIGATTNNWYKVFFINATTGWVVGAGGAVARTTNGGTSWTVNSIGVATDMNDVYFVSTTQGWAVGNNGVIRTTTDGGVTWTAQTSGTTQNLQHVQFVSTTQGWAVGANGVILTTTNGGATWTTQTSGTTNLLLGLHMNSSTQGWAVGATGTILSFCSAPSQPGTISGPASICPSVTATYSVAAVGGADFYTWSIPSGWTGTSSSNTISVTSGTASGTFSVYAHSGGCRSLVRTLSVTTLTVPAQPGTISGSNNVCESATQIYSVAPVAGATTYSWAIPATWAGSSTTNSISTTVGTVNGNVAVRAGNGSCWSTIRTLAVNVNTVPAQPGAIAGNTLVCPNTLNTYSISSVVGATSYSWQKPVGYGGVSGTNTIGITVGSAAGTITVSALNGLCPSPSRTLAITLHTVPAMPSSISGPNNACINSTTIYSVSPISGATTYSWSLPGTWTGTSTTNTISALVGTAGGSVFVAAGNSNCYSLSTLKTVSVTASPTVVVSSSTTSICPGSNVGLSATGATTYTWNTGSTSASINVTPTLSTTYTVTGTTGGCTNSKTISITVSPTPTVNTTASSATICSGGSSTLTATGASSYTWNTGATTAAIAVSPSVATTYTVIGSNGTCSSSRTITIYNDTPNLLVNSTASTICTGGSSTLTASGASTYSWSTGATGNSLVVSPSSNTTYSIIGINGVCSATSAISINVSSAISVNIIPSASVSCSGAPVVLTANGASTYTWNTGSNSTTISVTPSVSTNYTVNGNSGTCSGSTVITIGVSTNPSVSSITSNSTTCATAIPQSATLTASGASTYSWSTGAGSVSTVVSPSVTTTYTVTGTNASGCSNTSQITVTVNPLPTVNVITSNPLICTQPTQQTATLTASGASTYSWNTGATSAVVAVSPSTTTTYTVIGTDANGCQNSSVFTQSVSVCSGVEEQIISNEFTVYPNPNNGSFSIHTSTGGVFEIYNQLGQVIFNFEKQEGIEETIKIDNLAEGVYYMYSNSAKLHKKIIVTK